jgi:hypothetical protein
MVSINPVIQYRTRYCWSRIHKHVTILIYVTICRKMKVNGSVPIRCLRNDLKRTCIWKKIMCRLATWRRSLNFYCACLAALYPWKSVFHYELHPVWREVLILCGHNTSHFSSEKEYWLVMWSIKWKICIKSWSTEEDTFFRYIRCHHKDLLFKIIKVLSKIIMPYMYNTATFHRPNLVILSSNTIIRKHKYRVYYVPLKAQ